MNSKRTILFSEHIALGAKIVPFAGYEMPVQYQGISLEHEAVRTKAGIFDVSHMGEFIIKGEGALAFLQQVTSNDIAKLYDGKAQYSCFPNEKGGIIDDLLVYRIDSITYMLVVNASNIEKDWNYLMEKRESGGYNVTLKNISEQTALIAVQGPNATEIMQQLTEIDLKSLSYYTFKKTVVAEIQNVLVSATGYTGAGGFELYLNNSGAVQLWNKILEAGKPFGLIPAGLAARDTLRLEMGYCLYGNDITDTTSPLEAGLEWITKFNKKFTGSYFLESQKKAGLSRHLLGFEMLERGIPRHGYDIFNTEGVKIGVVTSGTHSPSLGKGIGLGYIATPYQESGTQIKIMIRDSPVKAQITKLPFYTT